MENVLIDKHAMQDIGNAIRTKHNNTTKLKPAEMAPAILSISGEKSSKVTVNKTDHINTQINVYWGQESLVANSGQSFEQVIKPNNIDVQVLLQPDKGWKANGYTLSKPSYVLGDDIVVTVSQALKLEDKNIRFDVHKASRISGGYAITPNNNLPEYTCIPELMGSSNIVKAARNMASKYAVVIQDTLVMFIALFNDEEYRGIDISKPLKDFSLLSVDIDDTGQAIDVGNILIDIGEGENRYHCLAWQKIVSNATLDTLFIAISNFTGYVTLTSNTKKINEYFPFFKLYLENIFELHNLNVPWEEIRALGETIGDFTVQTDEIYNYVMILGDNSKTVQERANAFYCVCYHYNRIGYLNIPNKPTDDIDDNVRVTIEPQ